MIIEFLEVTYGTGTSARRVACRCRGARTSGRSPCLLAGERYRASLTPYGCSRPGHCLSPALKIEKTSADQRLMAAQAPPMSYWEGAFRAVFPGTKLVKGRAPAGLCRTTKTFEVGRHHTSQNKNFGIGAAAKELKEGPGGDAASRSAFDGARTLEEGVPGARRPQPRHLRDSYLQFASAWEAKAGPRRMLFLT